MVSDEAALVVGVRLRALGPVEAVVGGELVDLGPPKQRALFALLLSRVDQPVAVDTLIEELWSGNPPAAAMASPVAQLGGSLTRAREFAPRPTVVSTDRAAAYPRVLDELPSCCPPLATLLSSARTSPSKPITAG